MEQRRNVIVKGKQKDCEKNLSQCHFVNHKSHLDTNQGLRSKKLSVALPITRLYFYWKEEQKMLDT